jgi:hypothetical protein
MQQTFATEATPHIENFVLSNTERVLAGLDLSFDLV